MGMFQRVRASNALIGIFLLVLLGFFIGPNLAPNLIPRLLPFIDEGIDCRYLRTGEFRARHQSLIGRLASDEIRPLAIDVEVAGLPTQERNSLLLRIIMVNLSVGTVPFVWPGDVLVNNTGINGVGVVFNNNPIPAASAQQAFIPDSNIKLLAPRQRCVLYVEIPGPSLAGLGVGQNSVVRAFYRNTTRGALEPSPNSIFPDQGLWVGLIESTNVSLLSGVVPAQ